MPNLWTPKQLDSIERKYPHDEVRALVTEIRRLNAIAWRAHDVVGQLDQMPSLQDSFPSTLRAILAGLRAQLETPVTGKRERT